VADIDIAALASEITADPEGIGYTTTPMADQEVVDSLNGKTRTRIRAEMTGDEIFQQTNLPELDGILVDKHHKQQLWLSFCARTAVDPGAAANIAFVQHVFGAGPTLTALNAARLELISRSTELGFNSIITMAQVIRARAI